MSAGAARKLDPPAPDPEGRTPESFIEEIQQIFNAGTLRGAREVAEQGLALYPDHPELRRLHHALRPVESRSVSEPRQPDRRETFQWIRENAWKYRGQWIAVLGSKLIAASPDFDQVYQAALANRQPEPPVLHFVE
ncbi:MAG TPA: DUF5678 domain-containing protein [Thermoanaerobaculia bacterium]|jgi:hypothetical protein|nr:DUF5678 domain-containing protein [Thermoanaerobaculia bacterium]